MQVAVVIELNHIHDVNQVILDDPRACAERVSNANRANYNVFLFDADDFLLEELDLFAFIVGSVELAECLFCVGLR